METQQAGTVLPRSASDGQSQNGTQQEAPDPLQAVLEAISTSLGRRGYVTTEWWTTIIAGGISALLGAVGMRGPTAVQVVGVLAPVLVAVAYALIRTMQKSTLKQVLVAAAPQAITATNVAVAGPTEVVQQATPIIPPAVAGPSPGAGATSAQGPGGPSPDLRTTTTGPVDEMEFGPR